MLVIETEADLQSLHTRVHRVFLGREERKYSFHLPGVDNKENERLSILLNQYMNECGCSTGSFTMMVFLAVSVAYFFVAGGTIASATFDTWLGLAGFTFAGAATGKLAGLVYARWKLIRLVRHAASQIPQPMNHHHQSLLQG